MPWPTCCVGPGSWRRAPLMLLVLAENRAQAAGNLADRSVSFGASQDLRHQVIARPGGVFERAEAGVNRRVVARSAQLAKLGDLLLLDFGIDRKSTRLN